MPKAYSPLAKKIPTPCRSWALPLKKSKMVFQSRTKKYENFGKVTYRKDGERIKKKGYKLVFIQKVDGDDYFVVAAVLLPLNVHESTMAESR